MFPNPKASNSIIIAFLNGQCPDHCGRSIDDILQMNYREIENTHDFIQWIFPTSEKSGSLSAAPILNKKDIQTIRERRKIKNNMRRCATWFLSFLEQSDVWKRSYNHYQLRISRVIKCLKLAGLESEASVFHQRIFEMLGDAQDKINSDALIFWNEAVRKKLVAPRSRHVLSVKKGKTVC